VEHFPSVLIEQRLCGNGTRVGACYRINGYIVVERDPCAVLQQWLFGSGTHFMRASGAAASW
jgi:hypothetical protein